MSLRSFYARAAAALSLTLTLLALIVPAGASPAGDARAAIQAAYAGMDRATANRSAAGYSIYLTPDFVGVDEKGKETAGRDATVQALSGILAQVKAARSATQIQTLTLQDGGAVVVTHSTLSLTGTKNGQPFVI